MLYQFLSLSFFRQLCLLLNAEDIYRALSEIIVQEEDLLFASLMVRYLNMILLTSSELFDLRDQLRELATPVSNSQYRMCFDFELRESLSSASSLLAGLKGNSEFCSSLLQRTLSFEKNKDHCLPVGFVFQCFVIPSK